MRNLGLLFEMVDRRRKTGNREFLRRFALERTQNHVPFIFPHGSEAAGDLLRLLSSVS
jgi:hypothetical protein